MKDSRELVKKQTVEQTEIERQIDTSIPIPNVNYQMYRGEALQEHNPLFEYWKAVRKRLWLVIGITVLFTTLAAIYMARRPNIYMANARVQVDLENANEDKVASERRTAGVASDPGYFNTQLQLLTSSSLLRRTIKELSLDSNKEFQKERNESSVSPLRAVLRTIGLASDDKKDKEGVDEVPLSENTDLVSTEEIEEAIRLAPYVALIKKDISVDPVRESRAAFKETRLIAISYRHTNPELAAYVVNGIAGVFTQVNQEKRTGVGQKTNSFLQQRIANLETEVNAAEKKRVELEENAGILKTDNEQTIVTDRLAGLNGQLLKAEEERKNAEAQFNAINSSRARLNALVEDKMAAYLSDRETQVSRLQNTNNQTLTELKAERKKLLVEFKDTAPQIEEIDRKIDVIKTDTGKLVRRNQDEIAAYRRQTAKALLEGLRTRYISAKSTEDKIRRDFNSQYGTAQGQNKAALQIRLVKQDIETKRGFLKKLYDSQEGNDVVVAGTDNNISVVEFAIPNDRAVAPRRITTVMAAMLLSLLFGSGLALFLEYLDDTIKTTEEVERYLQIPALAAIPSIESMPKRRLLLVGSTQDDQEDSNRQLLINRDTRSSMAEAYRQLRTSILLSTAGHAPKSLLITSSLPAEGKTTTAINTAISLAQTGANVLVVDADMRRPRLHSVFSKSNAEGLSTILSSDLDKDDVLDVIQLDEETNLFLLPSGPIPPNPAELIGSEQMKKLISILEGNFTHVVIDSPPIASFTDGVLIASLVDGVILVVHSGKSSRQVIFRSRQLLQDIGSKIFGVVLNNVNLNSSDNSYYYQSYYHRDSYNYDETEED